MTFTELEAKKMYFHYQCNPYYMKQDDVLDKFSLYGIGADVLCQWTKEYADNLFKELCATDCHKNFPTLCQISRNDITNSGVKLFLKLYIYYYGYSTHHMNDKTASSLKNILHLSYELLELYRLLMNHLDDNIRMIIINCIKDNVDKIRKLSERYHKFFYRKFFSKEDLESIKSRCDIVDKFLNQIISGTY